ncbi:MAG: hypothetical protein V1933_04350, partial [Candidatus Omnitrophota bacterium]
MVVLGDSKHLFFERIPNFRDESRSSALVHMGLLRNATKVSLRATKGSVAIYFSDDKKRLLRHFVPRKDTQMVFRNSP